MFEILSSVWALDSRYYATAKSIILARIANGLPALDEQYSKPVSYTHVDAKGYPTMWYAGYQENQGIMAALSLQSQQMSSKYTAIIPVVGTIQKRSGLCSQGTKDYAAMLDYANQDDSVNSIVMEFDGPGGSVDGTKNFADAIYNSKKPVVAYVDGMSASAHLWLTAQTKQVFVNDATTAWLGSIGTLVVHIDQTAFLEKQGMKVQIIRADKSVDKAKGNAVEPLTESDIAAYKEQLNSITETFIADVKRGRGDKLTSKEDLFTGKMYDGATAIKYGLADKIGSLKDAVKAAQKLAS
jgi:protease IV